MREGTLQGRAAWSVLRTLEPGRLADLDLGSILASAVRQGDSQVIDSLDELPLSRRDVDALNEAILGLGERSSWVVQTYLLATKRLSWPAAQPVLELGLALGSGRSSLVALAPRVLHPKPPADYIRWVIDTHDLEARTVKSLQGEFDLR